ncbi:MAG: F0F1 ATP synthase subunit A [Coriobacteriales bacterium]|nr:F0F1 ATP synthase subunit A [Coriobacteriales bacterium]
MDILASFPEQVSELVNEFLAPAMIGTDTFGLTQYIFWMCVAIVVLFLIIWAARNRESLVPRGRFINGFEFVVEFVRNDVIKATLGKTADKHAPFLLTIFFFILVNNVIGVIPGCKPGTGTIGVTFALALYSFIYFIVVAVKKMGGLGYIKSFAPAGVGFPMNVLVGIIEAFSTFLRLITLAVRLFANMFAGHICLGSFALLTSLFFTALISAGNFLGIASIAWLAILVVIYAVEIVVAAIQAYVFAMLSAVYIQLAEADAH